MSWIETTSYIDKLRAYWDSTAFRLLANVLAVFPYVPLT